MEETKKTLCPSCGEEMQEFRGKYFCLACGNEYEEKVDDLGEKNIVLISGNPMKEKTTDSDIPGNDPVDSDIDTDTDTAIYENDAEEPCNTSGSIVRGIIIGALAGVIALAIIFSAAIMLKSCSGNNENKNENPVSENVIDKNEEEKQPAVQGDEDKDIEKEDEPTPTVQPSATPTVTPTPAPTATPTAKPTETPVPAEQDTLYRVRLAADDASSQLGAFRNLDSAKDLAKQNKADGYKVYDQDGKLVYKP